MVNPLLNSGFKTAKDLYLKTLKLFGIRDKYCYAAFSSFTNIWSIISVTNSILASVDMVLFFYAPCSKRSGHVVFFFTVVCLSICLSVCHKLNLQTKPFPSKTIQVRFLIFWHKGYFQQYIPFTGHGSKVKVMKAI